MLEDDQNDVAREQRTRMLSFSMMQTKVRFAVNVYNRAFNSSYPGGDGVSRISSAHPLKAGGTQSIQRAVAAQLSDAALEQARVDIMRFKNDRGLLISVQPGKIIIPPELEAELIRT